MLLYQNVYKYILQDAVVYNKHLREQRVFAMGWIVSPQSSYVETIAPSTSECDCILRQSLKDVTKLNEVRRVGPRPI